MKFAHTYLLPAVYGVFLILDHPLFFFIVAASVLGVYISRVFWNSLGYSQRESGGAFMSVLVGLLWPVVGWLVFLDSECREEIANDLSFLVKNKFYCLRNPVVITKSSDEVPNNTLEKDSENSEIPRQEGGSRPARSSDYLRPRSRH